MFDWFLNTPLIKQPNAEFKPLKTFVMEQLYVMKKMIEDLQGQKVTRNHSIVTESLNVELTYLRNENLIIKLKLNKIK